MKLTVLFRLKVVFFPKFSPVNNDWPYNKFIESKVFSPFGNDLRYLSVKNVVEQKTSFKARTSESDVFVLCCSAKNIISSIDGT